MNMRVGHGYDVHRLVEGRTLVLGGVVIPYEKGLLGHSDADVLLHAAMDAVLGALGARDIGYHFPDTDEKYRGISSLRLLDEVVAYMKNEGYTLSNLDVTVIAQRPKLAPYIEEMRQNIASAFSCELSQINVKGTTEEGLGFTGTGEGIAAHAVCLLQK